MIATAYYHRAQDAIVIELRGEETGIPDVVMDRAEALALVHEIIRSLAHQYDAGKQLKLSEPSLETRDVSTG